MKSYAISVKQNLNRNRFQSKFLEITGNCVIKDKMLKSLSVANIDGWAKINYPHLERSFASTIACHIERGNNFLYKVMVPIKNY